MAGYGTDQLFADWLANNGYSAATGDLTVAQLRQRGSDYIDALYEASLPGYRSSGLDQERAWPRTGAVAYGQPIAGDAIPANWIRASYHAALHESANPGSLAVAASAAGAVKREKIDVIETEYFAGSGDAAKDATVRLSAVEGLVAPFLVRIAPGLGVWSIG